jgi:hypothetical protein
LPGMGWMIENSDSLIDMRLVPDKLYPISHVALQIPVFALGGSRSYLERDATIYAIDVIIGHMGAQWEIFARSGRDPLTIRQMEWRRGGSPDCQLLATLADRLCLLASGRREPLLRKAVKVGLSCAACSGEGPRFQVLACTKNVWCVLDHDLHEVSAGFAVDFEPWTCSVIGVGPLGCFDALPAECEGDAGAWSSAVRLGPGDVRDVGSRGLRESEQERRVVTRPVGRVRDLRRRQTEVGVDP